MIPTYATSSAQAAAVLASLLVSTPPVDLVALAAAQPSCGDCQWAASSSALRVTNIKMDNMPIMVDTSTGVFRPLVPAAFRRPIFNAIHGLAHPGICITRRLIASHFVLPCLASQVAAWCQDCQHCQRAKVVAQPSSPPLAIANPVQRFSHLHVDLVGFLPQSSSGFSHLLTVVDRSTRWAEAIPSGSPPATAAPPRSWKGGYPGSTFLSRSPPTRGPSSPLRFGQPSPANYESKASSLRRTTPRPMVQLNASTASSKICFEHVWRAQTGHLTFPGSC